MRLAARRLSTATAGSGERARHGAILAAALKHVPAHGWSTHALAAGAAELGLSPSAHALVSGGGAELVAHFQQSADTRLSERLQQLGEGETGSTVAERLSVAMKLRLSYLEPYASTWAQAVALQALPTHAPATVLRAAALAGLLDEFAHSERVPYAPASGDAAAGTASRPTSELGVVAPTICARRAAIGAAYGLAELHVVADSAQGPGSFKVGGEPDLSQAYGYVDKLCAGLERGALSLQWLETEMAHAAVHSRLFLGVMMSLGNRR